MQISEVSVKVCFIGPPRQPVDARGGITLERVERHPQPVDVDVVEESGEPLLLPLPWGLSYAFQRLGHAFPVLCPVRALLPRVPLGPRPWLHRLRSVRTRFVRRLPSYYDGVRLLTVVHHRLRLLAFPMRTSAARVTWLWSTVSSPGSRARSVRTCRGLRPRRAGWALALACRPVLPS